MIAARVCSLHSTKMSGRIWPARSTAWIRRSAAVELFVDEERELSGGGEVPAAGLGCSGGRVPRGAARPDHPGARAGAWRMSLGSLPRPVCCPHPVGCRRCAPMRMRRGALAGSWRVGAPPSRHEVEGLTMSTVSANGRCPHVTVPNSACRCSQPVAEGSRRPSDLR